MFVYRCEASGTTVSYSPARHPACVDGSPVWPPDRDVNPTFLARHRACLGGRFVWVSNVPGSQIRFHLGKPGGKQRDRNGEIWLPNLASTWTSQGGNPKIHEAGALWNPR